MYIDVYWKVCTDTAFRKKIAQYGSDIARLERAAPNDHRAAEALKDKLVQFYLFCNHNPGLLVPHFFPNYPKPGRPLSLVDRPFSFSMFNFQMGGWTVIRASRQIGKSTSIAARQLMNAHILPGYRSLYIVPHEEHRKTYANRLREMERAFIYFQESAKHRQNLNYKEYPNGSIIELIRVLTTAAESRGKTTDEILFDEYQHFDATLEAEVDQTQKASFMPSKIYSGTSLTVDTPLETRWLQSSQGEWHIRAMDGKNWINTGDKDQVLKVIQEKGPTCPYTGRILNVTDGVYVHRYPELLKKGKVGLHIPQLIIPDLVNKPIKWKQIWDSFNDYDQKNFLQEVLGIPTLEGAREITLEELKATCVLTDNYRQRMAKANSRYYKHIVSGCDWGGSDYNPSDNTKVSFTVHVILGLAPDGGIDILHMRKYSGMNYREVANDIIRDHKAFNGTAIASDFGVGAAYNMLLREVLPADRHFIYAYTGPRTSYMSPPQGHGWFNQYSLNRTESITQLYTAMKKQRIRCYGWEEAQELLLDFMNLYRVPTENSNGTSEFKYRRHGSKPDDTLHAINFGYTMMRLIMGEPLLEDVGLLRRVVQQLKGSANFGPPFGGSPRVIVG